MLSLNSLDVCIGALLGSRPMKPAPFSYLRPGSLEDALTGLAHAGDEAKVLAGGQSLIPLMNFRLARPAILIDLNLLTELTSISEQKGQLVIGAMTRQSAAEKSANVRNGYPLLAEAMRHIGHIQIRNRGTVGGSLAHADPAAELPAVALALDAQIEAQSSRGSRQIAANDFFAGPFSTSLAPDEILTAVRFERRHGWGHAFLEVARRAGDFALAGVAVSFKVAPDRRSLSEVRIGAFGVGPTAMRLMSVERVMRNVEVSERSLREAAAAASEEVDPSDDIHADADYRRRLIGHLVRRALEKAPA